LQNSLRARNPKSIRTCTLLLKPDALKTETHLDHVGFKISNEFVVGFGLDYQGYYRNLPYIAQVQNIN
jgi:hypoxanthine phosphoribosyltransferase